MRYTTKDTFILAVASEADPDSLEAIMAGSEAGAEGSCITVDLTADGIAVLCSNGGFRTEEGFLPLREHTYFELRAAVPKIVTVGQAIELAKCCSSKLAITLGSLSACAAVRIALSTAGMIDDAYFYGGNLQDAARMKTKYPAVHVVGDLAEAPPSPAIAVHTAKKTHLFGLRAHPRCWTVELIRECRRAGLFLISSETDNIDELEQLIDLGLNFIETSRPDRAYSFLPVVCAPAPPEPEIWP